MSRVHASRYAGFVIVLLGTTLGGLAQTAVNTSLSAIMVDLGSSVGVSQWLSTIYAFCMGITIPLITFLIGRYPVRGLYLGALGLFFAGSLVCYGAPVFPVLLAGRVMQACATGVMFPLIQLVAFNSFPPERRGVGMGIVGLTMSFAPNIGPTIAGSLTTVFTWRSCFLFLAAFSGLLLLLGLFLVHMGDLKEDTIGRDLDLPSLVLSTLGFGGVLAGFSDAADFGLTSISCLLPLSVGIVALVLFVRRQRRIPSPLMDLKVFSSRGFTVGVIITCMLFGAFIGVTLVIPLYVQEILGRTAQVSGLILLPSVLAALIASPLAGAAMDRFGARPVVIGAASLLTLGTVMLLHMGQETSTTYIALWQMVRTFGISSLTMPVTTVSLLALPEHLVTDGTSVINTLRQVAAALSTSAMVLVMTFGDAGGAISALGVDNAMSLSLVLSLGVLGLGLFVASRGRKGVRS